MMILLKESPLFPLELGTKVNLIGVTMLWWDMSATGDGKIKKFALSTIKLCRKTNWRVVQVGVRRRKAE